MATAPNNLVGVFLRDRRARLDPAAFGFSVGRRRTPGLRREEVAQRAHVSATWYTWLEQGRGGAPSLDVLDRVATALTLTAAEREHLFLLAGRQQPIRRHAPDIVTERLQRLLGSLEFSPAYVKTSAWDVVAWNEAAAAVLTDYGALAPEDRNILRILFRDARARATMRNWATDARKAIATFRLEVARTGTSENVQALVEELSHASPDFAAMWRDNDVSSHGEGTKYVEHKLTGPLTLEYSAFAIDNQSDLGLVVFTPATAADAARVKTLKRARQRAAKAVVSRLVA